MAEVRLSFTKVCEGLAMSEGPVFDPKGNFYAVAPMDESTENDSRVFKDGIAGKLFKINLDTGEKVIATTPNVDGFGGRPAGCQSDKEGNIWIADMRLGILKYTPGGDTVQISRLDSDGNVMFGCNDLVFDDDGNLWVTAPGCEIAPGKEDIESCFKSSNSCVYFLEKGSTTPIRLSERFRFSNGIAIKGDTLLVAETMTQSIIAFDIIGPGKVNNRREWARLPFVDYDNPMKIGGPDGIDFDANGRLVVAHHGDDHLDVFSPEGKIEKRVKLPFRNPSNLHFKPGSRICYVTEHENHALWKFEWECEGMLMFSDK